MAWSRASELNLIGLCALCTAPGNLLSLFFQDLAVREGDMTTSLVLARLAGCSWFCIWHLALTHWVTILKVLSTDPTYYLICPVLHGT